jgi:predicted RNase H-like HicB family nuclease
MRQVKIIIEKHIDGYVAYPLGLKGVVVGEGDTLEDALADIKSAISFHIESFGDDAFDIEESPALEAFIVEVRVAA